MPKSKNAMQRYIFLHQKLKTLEKYSIEDLIEAYAQEHEIIAERTLRYDVNALKTLFNAPIVCKQRHYFYSEPYENLLLKNSINTNDLQELHRALDILQHFKHLPQCNAIMDLLNRLKMELSWHDKMPRKIIDFEEVKLQNAENLKIFYDAIYNEQALNIHYLPFTDNIPYDIIIYPQLLKEFRHRWYIVGIDKKYGKLSYWAVDRILYFKIIEDKNFIRYPAEKAIKHFANVIGMTVPKNAIPERIVVRLALPRGKYVLTKNWHHSQKILSRNADSVTLEFKLIINNELRSRILEYTSEIEVLEPLHLRQEIAEMLKTSLKLYE